MRGSENCDFVLSSTLKSLKDELLKKHNDKINSLKPQNNSNNLPLHLQKIVPKASKEFLQWFVGFADAESTFSIVPSQNWNNVSLRFTIEVHIDDMDTLHRIKDNLGIGNINNNKTNKSAVFFVNKFEDITSVLIPIFKEFPLQTTKYLDFSFFLEACLIKLNIKKVGLENNQSTMDLIKLKKLKESMNSNRLYITEQEEENFKKKMYLLINDDY